MKNTIIFIAACALSVCAVAKGGSHSSSVPSSGGHVNSSSHSISGYTTKNGTYVAPSRATNPNGTKEDNYSNKGNTNPYTGSNGTKD